MAVRKVIYDNGTIFTVPLSKGGYALGLIIRNADNIILGHFLNQKFDNIPDLHEVGRLFYNPQNIVLTKKIGSLGLDKGVWHILGKINNWDEFEWPVPQFLKRDLISNQLYKVYYDNELKFIRQEIVGSSSPKNLPEDGTAGYGLIEKKLSNILDYDARLDCRLSYNSLI